MNEIPGLILFEIIFFFKAKTALCLYILFRDLDFHVLIDLFDLSFFHCAWQLVTLCMLFWNILNVRGILTSVEGIEWDRLAHKILDLFCTLCSETATGFQSGFAKGSQIDADLLAKGKSGYITLVWLHCNKFYCCIFFMVRYLTLPHLTIAGKFSVNTVIGTSVSVCACSNGTGLDSIEVWKISELKIDGF